MSAGKKQFRKVQLLRQQQGYTGQDCDLCPGRELCVEAWDTLVGNINRHVFPCGLEVVNPWCGEDTRRSLMRR